MRMLSIFAMSLLSLFVQDVSRIRRAPTHPIRQPAGTPPSTSDPTITNLGVVGGDAFVLISDINGNIDAAWFNPGDDAIIFTHSLDGGATFETTSPMLIGADDELLQSLGRTPNLQLGVDAMGEVTILWWVRDGLSPIGEGFIIHSTDGINFMPPVNLNIPNSSEPFPQLVVSPNGTINVAWVDLGPLQANGEPVSSMGPVMLMTSTNGGITWSTPTTIVPGPIAGDDFTLIGRLNQVDITWKTSNGAFFTVVP
jgi:hypothetical protein